MATPDDQVTQLIDHLRARVPGLPPDLATSAAAPLSAYLDHTTIQAIFAVAQAANVDLARDALSSDVTLEQLAYWLAPALAGDSDRTSPSSPRGSYRTPNITLRPLRDSDLGSLYEASLDPRLGHRWRLRGQTPAPDTFRAIVHTPSVLAQFMVVVGGVDGPAVGLVSGYDADLVGRHCKVAMQRLLDRDAADGSAGLMVEGFGVFAEYLFDHFDLAKLYLEVPEYNAPLLNLRAGTLLRQEGELHDHHYYGDRRWSLHILSLYREDWDGFARHLRGEWRS